MLRTIPNNTHGSLMRRFAWDVPLMLSVNENCLQQEKVRRIVLDGTMTVESDWTAVKGSLSLTRVLFPSVDEAAFCEKYILKNTGEKPLYVEIPRARSVIRTAPAKGVEGSYELVAEICGDTALMLAPRAEVAFGAFFSGRRSGDEALALNADAECAKRRALVAEWQRNLVLDTPDLSDEVIAPGESCTLNVVVKAADIESGSLEDTGTLSITLPYSQDTVETAPDAGHTHG